MDQLPFQHVVLVLYLLKICRNTTLVQFLNTFYYNLPVDQSKFYRKIIYLFILHITVF